MHPTLPSFFIEQLSQAKNLTLPATKLAAAQELSHYIAKQWANGQTPQLMCVCTHNSRRSFLAQFWAAAMPYALGLPTVSSFSAGNEVTRIHPNTMTALERLGVQLIPINGSSEGNPHFLAEWAHTGLTWPLFSKSISHEANPRQGFAAIMVCSSADEACPFVPGAEKRVTLNFDDPKAGDTTPNPGIYYDQTSLEIATAFWHVYKSL